MKLRVLLADDHTLFRKALRMALESSPNIEVVAEVIDGQGALDSIGEARPDVVCMDISMPGMNGIEATRQILSHHPEMKIIGLSAHADVSLVANMVNAGALGYFVKSGGYAELLKAIGMVSRNQRYISPEVAHCLGDNSHVATAAAELSPREQQVLQLLAGGCDPLQIAAELSMAANTAEAIQRNIMRKLDIPDYAGLLQYALRTCGTNK